MLEKICLFLFNLTWGGKCSGSGTYVFTLLLEVNACQVWNLRYLILQAFLGPFQIFPSLRCFNFSGWFVRENLHSWFYRSERFDFQRFPLPKYSNLEHTCSDLVTRTNVSLEQRWTVILHGADQLFMFRETRGEVVYCSFESSDFILLTVIFPYWCAWPIVVGDFLNLWLTRVQRSVSNFACISPKKFSDWRFLPERKWEMGSFLNFPCSFFNICSFSIIQN